MLAKVKLTIGYPSAVHEDVIEIDTDDYEACKTQEERDTLLNEYWGYWSSQYVDGSINIVEED